MKSRVNECRRRSWRGELAALEELAQAKERKDLLDSQFADLTEAITTLQDAITKIDMERDLLQRLQIA